MNLLSSLLLSTGIISIILGVIVYFLNRRNFLNQIFAITTWFNAYWAFTQFMMLESSNAETAYFWDKSSFLSPFSIALLLNFGLVFTENEILKNKKAYLLLYTPALVFSSIYLTTDLLSGFPTLGYWGYISTLPQNIGVWVVSKVWSAGIAIVMLILFMRYYFFGVIKAKKPLARYVALGFSLPILTGVLTDGVLPSFNVNLPSISCLSSTIYSFFVVFAIWKYKLFTLTPEIAAKNILDTVPDSVILTNLDGVILTVNRGSLVFFGYYERELVGKPISQLFANEEVGSAFLAKVFQEGVIRNWETKCKVRNGEEKTILFSVSLVTNDKDKGLGFVFTIRDITDLKQMQTRLVKAERLASIGQLAGMVGHDIRNPLQGIRLAVYRLRNKHSSELGSKGMELCDIIDDCVDSSDKIVNDLLDYSREIKLEREKNNPKSLLKKTLSTIQVPNKINVINNAQEMPEVSVDTEKMTRVLVNVVKNALDAMPNGGTLTITSKETGGNLEMSFADTGVGMSKETLSKLWVPLFTTKAKGMGLGLSICKRIVEAHGGKISAESAVGKGTIITITVPVSFKSLVENELKIVDSETWQTVQGS